ncbi:hypothetical protein K6119_17020 [Paracrocinitomix mangrovi]|uniref:hypothetical protein n=1 Tax=Paracrocinitomix mangrovi TaxID=2862509 RepID=UPI001C8D89B2|nr:hypothetical protein [Paracrocinitomix mangrovi]UKN01429.1 hypothetical protein K6119_17020 [Paracrocinitomix mangrovi]
MFRRKKLLLSIAVLISFNGNSQKEDTLDCHIFYTDSLSNKIIYSSTEKKPVPLIGNDGLFESFRENLNFDQDLLREMGVGDLKAVIRLYINEKGEVFESSIEKEIEGTNIARQMIEIGKEIMWSPGMCNNIAVSTFIIIPLELNL